MTPARGWSSWVAQGWLWGWHLVAGSLAPSGVAAPASRDGDSRDTRTTENAERLPQT